MTLPANPIAAVTHPDPYPYYATLARTPLYRDETLGLWIAASADAVVAVLTSDLCRVRPPAEPVPKALLGSPAADIFGRLVRMNDGAGHSPFKQAVSTTVGSVDTTRAAEQSRTCARRLLDEIGSGPNLGRLADFAFQLPVHVVASLLGVPRSDLSQVALWMSDFVRCLSPTSTAEHIERSTVAAGRLLELFRSLLADENAGGLLAVLARHARSAGRDDRNVIIANGIGFLSQAYEATAGLIGNTLITLARRHDVRDHVRANPDALSEVVAEVVRYDPPVQNTRRFLARDGVVAGQTMKENDAILVVLASANRDPAANSDPDRFDISRTERRSFTFGAGVHACPGKALATTMATAGVAELLRSGTDLTPLAGTVTYRASGNTRIPLLG